MDIAELKRLNAERTQGPWHWAGNTDTHNMYLATWTPGWGRCTVMDFSRWGKPTALLQIGGA